MQTLLQNEGRWDLIHNGCFWNTTSRSNICQQMMHSRPIWHHSFCHSPVYSKARRSTVVQINFTITPHHHPPPLHSLPPPPAQLETKYRQLGYGAGAGALLSPPAVQSRCRLFFSQKCCDFCSDVSFVTWLGADGDQKVITLWSDWPQWPTKKYLDTQVNKKFLKIKVG